MFMLMPVILLVPPALMLLNLTLFNKKKSLSREKSSPFECGFDPMSSPRLSFSVKFYMIPSIFLIFDIEIALILPLPVSLKLHIDSTSALINTFMLILILGLIYEWKDGALNWLS